MKIKLLQPFELTVVTIRKPLLPQLQIVLLKKKKKTMVVWLEFSEESYHGEMKNKEKKKEKRERTLQMRRRVDEKS